MSMSVAPRANNVPSTPSFLRVVDSELARVEEVLSQRLNSNVRTVTEASTHIVEAGGKRLRPSLVALCTRACGNGYDADRLAQVAACTEILHMATLMHDDVIDSADSRRGRVTANSIWGNQISVLTGDYMLAKAFAILADDGDARVMQAVSMATSAMIEGEVGQIETRGDLDALRNRYLAIIRDKTAAFTSACCRIGAILAHTTPGVEESLAKYGMDLGIAFQITDDLLDLIGDPARTGKPVGGDLREGKITLPIILSLEKANPADRERLSQIIGSADINPDDIEFARQLAHSTGAIDGTRAAAGRYITEAIECLNVLPPSDFHTSLCDLAEYVLHRDK